MMNFVSIKVYQQFHKIYSTISVQVEVAMMRKWSLKVRTDVLWDELEKQKDANSHKMFGLLACIAKLVLVPSYSMLTRKGFSVV